MACDYPQRPRQYSKTWTYPGQYPGYHCHPEPPEQGSCLPEPGEACGSDYYGYIHDCKSYPYDLHDLDKIIDMMENPEPEFYDLLND